MVTDNADREANVVEETKSNTHTHGGITSQDAGVKRGDVVALYMPVTPLAVAAMLATARIGAVHSVIFAGFSSEAVAARINDAGAKVVMTADEAVRGGKRIPLKSTVDRQTCSRRLMMLYNWREGA